MQKLIEAIPTKEEWEKLNEDEREMWFFTVRYLAGEAQLPKVDTEHHPAEMLAILSVYQPYIVDFLSEFDLAIDYNE